MFEQAPKRKIQQIKQSLKIKEKKTSAKFNSGEHFCFIVQKSLLINKSNMMVGNFPKKKSKALVGSSGRKLSRTRGNYSALYSGPSLERK